MGAGIIIMSPEGRAQNTSETRIEVIRLPQPRHDSHTSVERTLLERRSVRDFKKDDLLTLEEVSQLLWAAQGVTSAESFRTAPSAGATYPLEVFIAVGNVRNLPAGIYHYHPNGHHLTNVEKGDRRKDLSVAALEQQFIRDAAAVIVFSAVYDRTTLKYGERGKRYVHIEVGHAAQNVCLQAVALNIGTVTVGALRDDEVKKILKLTDGQEPLYIMPVGRKLGG